MRRRRSRQLQLSLGTPTVRWLPKDKEREVIDALAELLLAAAVQEGSSHEGEDEDERQDHC